MKNPKTYNSISEFFHSINLEIDQDLEFTIHPLDGLHGPAPMSVPPFRTNYHTILLIEDGLGHYSIDDRWFRLKPFSFYFTNPGHLKSFTIEKNVTGFMITFTESFLKAHTSGNVESHFPFLFQETVPVMYLPETVFTRLRSVCEILTDGYRRKSPFREKIVGNQLAGMLFQIKELLLSFQVTLENLKRPAEIAQRFRSALTQNFRSVLSKDGKHIWGIQEYAEYLHIHPNHLSTTIKHETGKTVKQWIDSKIISEANALLKNTTLTVAEIAYDLTFPDPANFSRFYKNITGRTPTQYRHS